MGVGTGGWKKGKWEKGKRGKRKRGKGKGGKGECNRKREIWRKQKKFLYTFEITEN